MTIVPEVRNFVNLVQQNINSRNQQQPRRRPDGENPNNSGSTCPICLSNTYFEVETNCGHKFCGKK